VSVASFALVALVACGGDSKPDAKDDAVQLPAQCTAAPYTVVAQRTGDEPAGSESFQVISAVAVPIPLVPNADESIPSAQVMEQGATTELLGYSLLFGDETFGPADVGLFSGYAPEATGKSRGSVGIFPNTTTPLKAGDVLVPAPMDGLGMFTTLYNIIIDFKATPDESTAYVNEIEGSVTILGITDQEICIDVDLSWEVSSFGSDADSTLTLQGVFTATLAERTLPFT
jgi:hypothetical protein